jgi:hypothetical protein
MLAYHQANVDLAGLQAHLACIPNQTHRATYRLLFFVNHNELRRFYVAATSPRVVIVGPIFARLEVANQLRPAHVKVRSSTGKTMTVFGPIIYEVAMAALSTIGRRAAVVDIGALAYVTRGLAVLVAWLVSIFLSASEIGASSPRIGC